MARVIAKNGNLKYALFAADTPIDSIEAGEVIQVECEINCNSGVVTSTESKLSPEVMTFPFVNPATGPFEVKGARRAQMPAVEILEMDLDSVEYTAFWPGISSASNVALNALPPGVGRFVVLIPTV